ncbi:MAG: valine--tRNA ligase [Candidatus Harrisonbacteria bacterium]|nr:valine--tRNA ligase [Candidatus Harrisonbacteria bacterium]
MALPEIFKTPYNPKDHEKRIYEAELSSGLFNPDNLENTGKPPYVIMMPPPNVTGVLHMGHALMLTIEDILIRYKRLQGYRTLWLPGTDHAAIATQVRVEKDLQKKEGKSRFDLGRDDFLKLVEKFAFDSHDTITSQIKIMGASCDWSREAYTLDEKRNQAVNTVFKKMHNDGLIYQGYRVVNFDVKGGTVVSDDELVYEERDATLYTFRYSPEFPIEIATTRPETKVGDTAVAVHPDDPRYQSYIGKDYSFDFCHVPVSVKIIADPSVEKDFGTGALGVTPAHSLIDADIAERHHLPLKQVISERGRMINTIPALDGKKTLEARETIVSWLKENNLISKEEKIKQNVATAERTSGIIEPLPKKQWFVAVNKSFSLPHSAIPGIESGSTTTLKEIMKRSVESGAITIKPAHFAKTYFNWVDNLRDWCVSRQIWFGHRIPVWYRNEEIVVSGDKPEGEGWIQDEDTLDTWFSSALWTFSTLGWPEKTKDLKTFHPTDVLETGYEIIFFWVARMIMMSGYALGEIPFRHILLHGTVRDAQGRKMSKSLGNGIDPLDIAEKYGADAGRLALVYGTAPGTDSKISEEKIKGMKHFANKLWNIARFILENTEDCHSRLDLESIKKNPSLTTADKAILSSFENTVKKVEADLEAQDLHTAAEELYSFVWMKFADEYLEVSKLQLKNETQKESTQKILLYLLENSLILLHPFIPFVTEAIYEHIPDRPSTLLLVARWPSL